MAFVSHSKILLIYMNYMCPTFFRFGLLVVVGNGFIKQIALCTRQKVPTKRVILFKKIYNLDQPHAGELGLSTGTLVCPFNIKTHP